MKNYQLMDKLSNSINDVTIVSNLINDIALNADMNDDGMWYLLNSLQTEAKKIETLFNDLWKAVAGDNDATD